MSTSTISMDQFFSLAGHIIRSWIRSEGESPRKKFIACWEHQFGYAEYDGRAWYFDLRNL